MIRDNDTKEEKNIYRDRNKTQNKADFCCVSQSVEQDKNGPQLPQCNVLYYIKCFLTDTNSPLLIKENIVLVVSIVVSDSVAKIWYSIRPISHFDILLYYWDNKTLRLMAFK